MNYQQLLISVGEQLARLTAQRAGAEGSLERAQADSRRLGIRCQLEIAATEQLQRINAQLEELASALGALARAAQREVK